MAGYICKVIFPGVQAGEGMSVLRKLKFTQNAYSSMNKT